MQSDDAAIGACDPVDLPAILQVINDAAEAYRGVIPDDCWHDPYMPLVELEREIAAGIRFAGYREDGRLIAVMGSQRVKDVTLIRHAYVATACRRRGVGGALLAHLRAAANRPILIGTWAAADWAIRFYEKHGFRRIPPQQQPLLLRRYWTVSGRQIETSVVLADNHWFNRDQG
jgi:GNAT superfamily N-acetyltransferase